MLDTIRSKIQKFNSSRTVRDLSQRIADRSLFEIVGIERKETRNSRFLQWIFSDPTLNASSFNAPIWHLLDAIIKRADEQDQSVDPEFCDTVICRNGVLTDVTVDVEVPTKGFSKNGKSGRIDLLICGKIKMDGNPGLPFSITVENKVDSEEHDNQTAMYYDYMTAKTTGSKEVQLFVYLSPTAEADMRLPLNLTSDKFIHINYQDIVNYILDPILGNESLPADYKMKIEQYLSSLSMPAIAEGDTKEDDTSAMAIAGDLQNLCLEFWNEQKELIIEAVRNNTDLLEKFLNSHRNLIETALKSLATFVLPDQQLPASELQTIKSLCCTLNRKYLVRSGDKTLILTAAGMAVEYAKDYYKAYPGKTIDELNQDFSPISNALWSQNCKKRKGNNYDTTEEIANGVRFSRYCWDAKIYVPKLIDFIGSHPALDFEILK